MKVLSLSGSSKNGSSDGNNGLSSCPLQDLIQTLFPGMHPYNFGDDFSDRLTFGGSHKGTTAADFLLPAVLELVLNTSAFGIGQTTHHEGCTQLFFSLVLD